MTRLKLYVLFLCGYRLTSIGSSVTILFVTYGENLIAKDRVRLNGFIKSATLRVIDAQGEQLGVMDKQAALDMARDQGLDLVEISPNASPPVAKIVDWGKLKYQKTKQAQKNRKSSKSLDVKQIRFGLKIGQHDLDVKLRKIISFLESGHKVKITVAFRGREMAHQDLGYKLLDRVLEQVGDIATVDQKPNLSGKHLSIVVRVSNNAKAKNSQRDSQKNKENV